MLTTWSECEPYLRRNRFCTGGKGKIEIAQLACADGLGYEEVS